MKKIIAILGLALCGFTSQAQSAGTVSLNGYAGYTFDETVPFDYVNMDVKGGLQYGGSLEYYLRPSKSIELKYNRLDSQFSTTKPVFDLPTSVKGSINYILLGGNNYFTQGAGNVIPYIGGSLGVAIIDGPTVNSSTHFAWDVRLGLKIKTESAIAVKLQAYLQSAVSTYGTDYYYDYWYGYVGVPDYHRILQFGLGTVLEFNFKH